MASRINLSKGLDISIEGAPRQTIGAGNLVSTVALSGMDSAGIRPRTVIETGQFVKVGDPLVIDKHNPAIQYTSPASGTVREINRGQRRVLQSVVVELDGTGNDGREFDIPGQFDRNTIRSLLLQSGAWTGFRSRPFNRVPDPGSSPGAIFITATDTRPLAADPSVLIARYEHEFRRGLNLISKLDEVPIFLCTGPDWKFQESGENEVIRVEFEGPHPAGLPGTHIHFLQPASPAREVWHIDYQQLIAIGHLLTTGKVMTERVVAVGGPGALDPRLLLTRSGANLEELLAGELKTDADYQVISGSVLDGIAADGPLKYLGHNHNQVSIIPDRAVNSLFGWFAFDLGGPTPRFPFSRGADGSAVAVSNAQRGRRNAMIPTEHFERVLPLDMLPAPLLRALLVEDTDSAQALGCLELAPEDLALCSYVCPAKQDYGDALRRNLRFIEEEG